MRLLQGSCNACAPRVGRVNLGCGASAETIKTSASVKADPELPLRDMAVRTLPFCSSSECDQSDLGISIRVQAQASARERGRERGIERSRRKKREGLRLAVETTEGGRVFLIEIESHVCDQFVVERYLTYTDAFSGCIVQMTNMSFR